MNDVAAEQHKRDQWGRPQILRGFTLVELVMVIGILAILAAIAVPRAAGTITRQRVEAAGRRLAGDVSLAQRYARLSSTAQQISFDAASSSYRLVKVHDPDRPNATYIVRLGDPPYGVSMHKVDFGGSVDFCVDGYGKLESGGSVALAAGEFRVTISVDGDTGRTTMDTNVVVPSQPAEPAEGPPEKPTEPPAQE